MNWLGEFLRRLRMLLQRRRFDAELEEEMRVHLELRERERETQQATNLIHEGVSQCVLT